MNLSQANRCTSAPTRRHTGSWSPTCTHPRHAVARAPRPTAHTVPIFPALIMARFRLSGAVHGLDWRISTPRLAGTHAYTGTPSYTGPLHSQSPGSPHSSWLALGYQVRLTDRLAHKHTQARRPTRIHKHTVAQVHPERRSCPRRSRGSKSEAYISNRTLEAPRGTLRKLLRFTWRISHMKPLGYAMVCHCDPL